MTSKIFNYTEQQYGGTEYMAKTFKQKVLPHMPKLNNYNCLLIPGQTPNLKELEADNKEIILWLHNTFNQLDEKAVEQFFIPSLVNKIKYFVAPSKFHKKHIMEYLKVDESKVVVIPNAIEPLVYNPDKFTKVNQVRLIHTSTSDRGTHILINSLSKIDRDFRLEIYNDFYPHLYPEYEPDPRIRFYGKTPKATVIEAVESSHIHAYPSTFQETFCISQAEAMSAGLLCVTSDSAALPEVSGGHTRIYPLESVDAKHAEIYAKHLTQAIDDVTSGNWNPEEQIKYVNSTYSWERHKEHWLELHNKL
jgi:glycosyltransferase involved in cell wall biosynthesis